MIGNKLLLSQAFDTKPSNGTALGNTNMQILSGWGNKLGQTTVLFLRGCDSLMMALLDLFPWLCQASF